MYRGLHLLSTAVVADGAEVIAHEPNRPQSAVMFAEEEGAEVLDGQPAPGRESASSPTTPAWAISPGWGEQLATAAGDWLVGSLDDRR